MKLEVHRALARIREAQGGEYGKIVQKLLAIAFLEAGARSVTDRGVQGVDLEVSLDDGRKLAFEVKTGIGSIGLADKDLKGLKTRREAGFTPHLAVLGDRLLDEWIFAQVHDGELRAAGYSPTQLRAYRDRDLEQFVEGHFASAVARLAPEACARGQAALNAVLESYQPRYAPA